MADENASLNPKKETVRITLPPRTNEPVPVKRETVRIAQSGASDKGQTIRIQPQSIPLEGQPKKETTKMVSAPVPPPAVAKPKSAPIPIIPPPPKPAGMPSVPPPKPPGAFSIPASKPSLGQAEAPAAPAPMAAPKPPSVPKKETSRIPIPAPAAAPRAPMPKATVKLQQTQPLPQAPVASVVKTTSLSLAPAVNVVNEADPIVLYASIAVCVASLAAAVLGYLAFSACA